LNLNIYNIYSLRNKFIFRFLRSDKYFQQKNSFRS